MKRSVALFCLFLVSLWALGEDTIPLKSPSKPTAQESKEGDKPQEAKTLPNIGEKPYVAQLEVYGSTRLTEKKLRESFGVEIDKWVKAGLEGDPELASRLQLKLQNDIRKRFNLAFAEWSILQYFEPGDLAIYITLDVVEKTDAKRRMPFMAAPKGKFEDPEGLIAAWLKYEETSFGLLNDGELDPTVSKCKVALHCPFGHEHPKLKPFERQFEEGVKKHFNVLAKIQSEDARPDYRAAATYLLAYYPDGAKVVSLMVGRINDPDPLVRNNALRVLGDIAEFHPKYAIPLGPVAAALDFPLVSDRSKALYTVYNMALNSGESHKEILNKAVTSLVSLLQCAQPNHRDVAVATLRKISGKNFAGTDFRSWASWAERIPAQK